MSTYQGRHRGQVTASSDPSATALTPVPTTTAASASLRGRHRPPRSPAIPRLAGTGALLPAAATATIVLTTTGAHLGGVPMPAPVVAVPSSSSSSEPAAARQSDQTDARQTRTEVPSMRLGAGPERVARSRERAPVPDASAHRWVTPLDARFTLTSGFGPRWGSMHPGQDFAVAVGTPVKAMSSGTVVFAGWSGGYGNKVEIRYWDGTISWYAHNSRLRVTTGASVTPGQVVALSGSTGHSTGPHSHLEIHLRGDDTAASAVPPIPWLDAHHNMPGRGVAGSPTASD